MQLESTLFNWNNAYDENIYYKCMHCRCCHRIVFKLMSLMTQTFLTTRCNGITSSSQHFDKFLGLLWKLSIPLSCCTGRGWYPWPSGTGLLHTVYSTINFKSLIHGLIWMKRPNKAFENQLHFCNSRSTFQDELSLFKADLWALYTKNRHSFFETPYACVCVTLPVT